MKRPNILFLFTDQQRADTIAALGNETIRTPNLDRLVREGVAYTRAYTATPVCVASRCSLATGQSAARNNCWDNNQDNPQDVKSYMELLGEAGYQTHGVGKMHFTPDHNRMWGYQARDVSEEGPRGDFDAFLEANGYGHVLAANGLRGELYYTPQPSQLPAHLHETHWVADRSIDFLKNRDKDKPFLLDCHFIKPHPPFENPMPWSFIYRTPDMPGPYLPDDYDSFWTRVNVLQNRYKYKDRAIHDDLAWRSMKAAYYAAISFIDYQVGRILDALGDEIDNTLIVYSSDHGEMMGDYGCVGKRCLLEASNRVPMIARLPGVFEGGLQVQRAVSLLDLFPTFLEAAGEAEKAKGLTLDGISLQESLRQKDERRIVFSQFQAQWMGNYMATDGASKYVYSAAEDKEFRLKVGDSLVDRHAEDGESAFDELKAAAIGEFARYPATEAVSGEGWTKHEATPWPEDPDYGLLTQDPEGLKEMLETIKPYSVYKDVDDAVAYKSIFDHMPHLKR